MSMRNNRGRRRGTRGEDEIGRHDSESGGRGAELVKKLGPADHLRISYEAEQTGYVVYWPLAQLRMACDVVAPSLVQVEAGAA